MVWEKPIMVLYSPQKAYTILDAFCGEYYYSELKSVFFVFPNSLYLNYY